MTDWTQSTQHKEVLILEVRSSSVMTQKSTGNTFSKIYHGRNWFLFHFLLKLVVFQLACCATDNKNASEKSK